MSFQREGWNYDVVTKNISTLLLEVNDLVG
jgi:hypothetical protein